MPDVKEKYRMLLVICWPVGGIRTFIRYTYNNFDSSRFHLTILAQDQPELRVLLNDLKDLDVSYVPAGHDPRDLRFMLSVMKNIIFGRYDIIHSQGLMSGIYSVIPASLSHTKHIMTAHDVLSEKQFNGLKGFFKKRALAFLLPKIDVIHSVSHDAHENLLEFIPKLKRSAVNLPVIPNGIDISRFSGSEIRDLRKELNLPQDVFLVGFLGRFMSQKGFRYLIEAIELLNREQDLSKKAAVVAFGFGGFIREDKEYIKEKGLENYFHFLPFTVEVGPALKGLDVVAMPSLWEACSLLAMEAMVAGVPLIGTDCIGLREVIKDTPCAMVPAGDSQALAKAIEAEMKAPSRSKTEAFHEKARARFDVKKQVAKLEQLILETLKTK